MVMEEQKTSPINQKNPAIEDALLSPGFKSAAAMAGWDEESLLLASLVVEDTPDRDYNKHKRRSVLNSKTPPTNSRRKRRAQRSPESIPVAVLDLDGGETPRKDGGRKNKGKKTCDDEASKVGGKECVKEERSGAPSSSSALPCIDKLREELSCAICLELCFEPSTTPCGHSFCRKCLRSAADKCGKRCPKCRQLISNGRSCTVNTVLWNTIQLLFPQEVEARKVPAGANNSGPAQCLSPETAFYSNLRNGSTQASTRGMTSRRRSVVTTPDEDNAALARRLLREIDGQRQGTNRLQGGGSRNQTLSSATRARSRRGVPTQDEDAALAQRLQRDEFMQAFGGTQEQSSRTSLSSARSNLMAMASRAINLRIRDRRV